MKLLLATTAILFVAACAEEVTICEDVYYESKLGDGVETRCSTYLNYGVPNPFTTTPDDDDGDDPKGEPQEPPKEPPTEPPVTHDLPKDTPRGNNGHGNGDQPAPGNSGGNNNAENSNNSGQGNSGNGRGGKKGTPNND